MMKRSATDPHAECSGMDTIKHFPLGFILRQAQEPGPGRGPFHETTTVESKISIPQRKAKSQQVTANRHPHTRVGINPNPGQWKKEESRQAGMRQDSGGPAQSTIR
jgi:hypothetical protein